jgi:hypothetical protein
MANFSNQARGIIEGLSDFWLVYFKEIDQLKTLYTGTDILMGQSYLDLLSLLMNNSVQDAPLYNKEYFKQINIKETETKYLQGTNPETDCYRYIAEENLVTAPFLNNKIFSVTASLERDVDYRMVNRQFEFKYDPLNAYYQKTFGTGNSKFTVRTRDPLATNVRISLSDDGTAPVAVSRSGTENDVLVQYDGTANTNTTSARGIVQAINLHPELKGLIYAELELTDGGAAAPADTGGFIALARASRNALDGFATRSIEQSFGGKFTSTSVSNWVTAGVQKGDILRLVSGPSIGTPQELRIDLVREDALYLNADEPITNIKAGDKIEFRVIREPREHTVIQAPLAASCTSIQTNSDGELAADTRQFYAPSATFSPLHVGDLIEILGTSNAGYARILSWVNAQTVTVGYTDAATETGLVWNHLSTFTASGTLNGDFTNNGNGTATFVQAGGPFTTDPVGTVIRIRRGTGELESYEIIEKVDATEVIVKAATTAVTATGLTWAWASYIPPVTTVAYAQIKGKSANVQARRYVDEQAVVEGRDFIVLEDTAQIKPLTTWRPAVDNALDYAYRLLVVSNTSTLQNGSDGTVTYGATSTFSAPTANFSYNDIGQALRISNSGILTGANNNVTYFIAGVTSATTVTLTSSVATTTDPNNGSLTWELLPRGTFETSNVTAFIQETSFWAPDALVDRFHLYNTFGYLINRYEVSSESYRSLIRGIFQLFMLGPTLERFESAINIIAGFPTVRDDGEILLDYVTGSTQSGSDGVLDGTTRTFSAASAAFTQESEYGYIYISTGLNENKLYKIIAVLSSTQVLLDSTITTDSAVAWEFSSTGQHTVTTSRQAYTFARTVPLRSVVTDPANVGVKVFRAFEVLTDVFSVTDYVETPDWWTRVQIPQELWEGEDALRRQSTPVLFENVIGPADDGRIGDPGFFIGADSLGFVPPAMVKYPGSNNGVLTGDILYPFSNNVYFESATASFTIDDVGNTVELASGSYRILDRLSATRVQLEAFNNVTSASGLTWSVKSQATPLRHKAAFVILDTWLKYQMFFVTFNPVLLGKLSAAFLTSLEDLVYVAKPAYTYLVVSPSSLFKETINVTEDELEITVNP